MKRIVLATLLLLMAGASYAQADLEWNVAATSDPVWSMDPNFLAPPQ